METPETEKGLVEAAKKGSLAAFEQILLRYEKAIFNYLYRLAGTKHDAEDLTQETFLKLYRNIRSADPDKKFKSWLYRIATHTAYDWLRKKRRHPESFLADADTHGETNGRESPYYHVGVARDVAEALGRIRPEYRTILLLYYRQGLGYTEIADVLSLPLNTVKTHLYRAKEALKQQLGESYG